MRQKVELNPQTRLYQLPIPIIAITGSIGSGKSTMLEYLNELGYPTLSADKLIKIIYEKESTKDFISKNFPSAIDKFHKIDFKILRKIAFKNEDRKNTLEQFLYPQLKIVFWHELEKIKEIKYIFYEIPLLFEKKLESLIDYIICISTSEKIQIERLVTRDNISEELAKKIIGQQLSCKEKIEKSDYYIENRQEINLFKHEIDQIIKKITY